MPLTSAVLFRQLHDEQQRNMGKVEVMLKDSFKNTFKDMQGELAELKSELKSDMQQAQQDTLPQVASQIFALEQKVDRLSIEQDAMKQELLCGMQK